MQERRRLLDTGASLFNCFGGAMEFEEADVFQARRQRHMRRLAREARAGDEFLHDIPSSSQEPKILWRYYAEIVCDRIAELGPLPGHFLA